MKYVVSDRNSLADHCAKTGSTTMEKRVAVDISDIRSAVGNGDSLVWIPTEVMPADGLTKHLVSQEPLKQVAQDGLFRGCFLKEDSQKHQRKLLKLVGCVSCEERAIHTNSHCRFGSRHVGTAIRKCDAPRAMPKGGRHRERNVLESTGEVDLSSSDDGMEVDDKARKHVATAGSAADKNPDGQEGTSRTATRLSLIHI